MNTNLKFYVFILTAIFLTQACNQEKGNQTQQMAPGADAIPVVTTQAEKEMVTDRVNYPARVVALNETELRAEVNGYITNILVEDGQRVKKGQKLYEIDRVRYEADVEQAKSDLAIAQTELSRIERDLERYNKLAEQDAIAKQTLDYAETDLSNRKAQVQAAKAKLMTAETNLNRSIITAPFDGVIGISQVRLGALVSQGSTLLNTISSTSPIAVEFEITNREIDKIINMQQDQESGIVEAILPDGSAYPDKGRISVIDRAVDQSTGTLKVRANFPNPNNKLRVGMNLALRISTSSVEELVVIPYQAVIEQLGTYHVFTVNDSSQAIVTSVQLGPKFEDKISIIDGVNSGDKVIIEGFSALSDGDKVTETDKKPSENN
ncbi:MAG TPA: efflux RND transporter periplasmic adaptor subunit [Sphingobacterium sp.]|nr:efflux RND transporter periplasmic adaptor subunit [Sphingobacterium sp.]